MDSSISGFNNVENEVNFRVVLDSLTVHIVVLDQNGVIRYSNRAWQEFARENGCQMSPAMLGVNYLEICEAAALAGETGAQEAAEGIRVIIKNARTELTLEYPCHSPDEQRWFSMRASRYSGEGSWRVVIAHENITQLKLLQEKLQQNRNLADNATDIIYRLNLIPDMQVDYINPVIEEFTGYRPEDLYQNPLLILKIIHPQDHPILEAAIKGLITTPQIVRLYHKNGFLSWTEHRIIPIYNETFNIIALEGIGRDITERIKTDEALRASEEKLRRVTDYMLDIISEVDEKGVLRYISPSLKNILGYKPAELLGISIIELLHPDDRERVRLNLSTAVNTMRSGRDEYRCRNANGQYIWLEVLRNVIIDEGGKLTGVVGVLRDITKRKEAENELQRVKERLEYILSSSSAILYACEPYGDYRTTFISENTRWLLGYEAEDFLESANFWTNKIHPDDLNRVLKDIAIVSKKGHHVYEYRFRRKDGSYRWMRDEMKLNRDEEGNPHEIIGYWIDITDNKNMEEKLRESQRLEALGTLSGGIAHDFNNILMAISTYTELSLLNLPGDSRVGLNLQQVMKATARAKDLIAQILAFSRANGQEKQALQLTPVIKEALNLLRATISSTIDIRQHISNKVFTVMANGTQMHQMMMNLCINAAQAMGDQGGILDVSLEDIYIGPEHLARYPGLNPGCFTKLTVSDTGYGMKKEVVERIFEPFYTTKGFGGGTGMGLAVVHGIVKSHKGYITVQSEPGAGTTFEVFLPVAVGGTVVDTTKTETEPEGSANILVVDDEESIVEALEMYLSSLGYNVITATDGIKALQIFQERPESFDLVITDQSMPNMTGTYLAIELLNLNPTIPVILFTGYDEAVTPQISENIGIRAYLTKPVLIKELADTIKNLLGK